MRGVVLVPAGHAGDPLDPLRQVARVVAEEVDERVGLDVGLVDHVEAELVAQVEEGRVVGVVRRAHGVEAEPLHEDEVGPHALGRDDAAGLAVEVVAVDAADEYPPAVEEEVEADDLDPPEADPEVDLLDDGPGRRTEDDGERVEVRHLGRPRPDVAHVGPQGHLADVGRRELPVEPRPVLGLLLLGERHPGDRPVGELAAVAAGARPSRGARCEARAPPGGRSARGPPPRRSNRARVDGPRTRPRRGPPAIRSRGRRRASGSPGRRRGGPGRWRRGTPTG